MNISNFNNGETLGLLLPPELAISSNDPYRATVHASPPCSFTANGVNYVFNGTTVYRSEGGQLLPLTPADVRNVQQWENQTYEASRTVNPDGTVSYLARGGFCNPAMSAIAPQGQSSGSTSSLLLLGGGLLLLLLVTRG